MQSVAFTPLRSLIPHPRQRNKFPIYWIVTPDYGDVQQLLSLILTEQEEIHSDVQYFDAETLAVELLRDELEAPSLFAEHKKIVLRRFEQSSSNVRKLLGAYLQSPSMHITLILSSLQDESRSPLWPLVEKKGEVIPLFQEKGWEKQQRLIQQVLEMAQKEKKKLAPELAQWLVRRVGNDASNLMQEMDKLFAYIGKGSVIEDRHIKEICQAPQQETLWHLRESILLRHRQQALHAMQTISIDGSSLGLLQLLRLHIQMACRICEQSRRDSRMSEIARMFPQLKGKNLEKTLYAAKAYGERNLQRALLDIAAADLSLRNGGVPEIVLELLVVKLTSGN